MGAQFGYGEDVSWKSWWCSRRCPRGRAWEREGGCRVGGAAGLESRQRCWRGTQGSGTPSLHVLCCVKEQRVPGVAVAGAVW